MKIESNLAKFLVQKVEVLKRVRNKMDTLVK